MLPGAFSVYRYIALQNDARGEGPSQKYFLGETLAHHSTLFHLFAPNNIHSTERTQISSPQWPRTALHTLFVSCAGRSL
ncbi:hypothetical protein EDB85DRAFT_2039176 [Lactarius pseudohatsudake]|nr:hypothetical protein EDB85DRAFT_2039176 [Lactarius pseudohatsudake]